MLCNIIQDELTKPNPLLYTTYSFDIEPVRTFILGILRSLSSPVDYKHILYREAEWTDSDLLDNYLYQYEFAGYGYNTYTAQSRKGLISASPLPYFLLTSDTAVFFSKDLRLYIVEKDKTKITYMHDFFQGIFKGSIPFSHFMRTKDDFSLFTSLVPNTFEDSTTYCYDLSSNLCLATYLSTDILADAIPDAFEHKDFFVHGVADYFNHYAHVPFSFIWEMDSLIKFVEQDEYFCNYHNVTFDVLHISPENKYKMLLQLKENINKKIARHFITIPNKFRMPSYFHMNTYDHNLILSFNFKVYDITDGQRYIAVAISQDPIIYKHLRKLAEYIEHSPYIYSTSTKYALSHIDNAIAYYRNKHNF